MTYLSTDIEFLKGVGPVRGEVLRKELGVKTTGDLLQIFPFRYIDKTKFQDIKDIRSDGDTVLLKGKIISFQKIKGRNRRFRLSAIFQDATGHIELIWFQKIKVIEEMLKEGVEYSVYGKVSQYGQKKTISHPEMEAVQKDLKLHQVLDPVYSSSEALDKIGLDNKGRRRLIKSILSGLRPEMIVENLSREILERLKLPSRYDMLRWIHIPADEHQKDLAVNRIKFEEFFFLQLELIKRKNKRKALLKGAPFKVIGDHFNTFFTERLEFELTGAQKKVIKEIRTDVGAGYQMNRLLQGDVGSGKTIVALMSMLMAIDNGFQACMMAPTEILATQHYQSFTSLLEGMPINVQFLSGSVKGQRRKQILTALEEGYVDILVGTHALIEDTVVFKNLGISITDEQHRFGVAQRASLWRKNDDVAPHILVMTATPIPRTLAMTLYGDLDVSVIDEMPPGRKPVKTIHKYEAARPKVIEFMHAEIAKGHQIYVVFPLIEESEKLDLENLQAGYDKLLHYFPLPDYRISVVHGKMKPADKEYEMKRFVDRKTQIMVATTVIEVGVNVPNANVMVIENAERFGLSQLHQLRGRVGRGGEQAFCILMTGNALSRDAKTRISTMVRTNNGFEIAETDLQLRGPGEMEGTRQSGVNQFKLLNLTRDDAIMNAARYLADKILEEDPDLSSEKNLPILHHLRHIRSGNQDWSMIS